MNSRDRVLAALSHREPDRLPIDFGGLCVSTISATAYAPLREALGLPPIRVRLGNPTSQTATIDDDVRQILGVDTLLVFNEPREWREGRLRNGVPALLPAKFEPQRTDDGSEVILDSSGRIVSRMPAKGLYFDSVWSPLAGASTPQDLDKHLDAIESCGLTASLDKSYEELGRKAKELRETTDYLLVGFFGGPILQGAFLLRGWEEVSIDLLTNPKMAEALFDRLTDAFLRRFKRFSETVGPYIDVVEFDDDLGMQDRPILRPELYRRLVKPYHARLFTYARANCEAHLLLHSDGAIAPLIPDLIEMGIDALNPVQVSATGMDVRELKRLYGRDITFWGAGCDSQKVLPFGSAAEVADEVRRRIDELAPGGGYVFGPIHNVQAGVPVDNVLALFTTALQHGVYSNSS